VFKTGGAHQVKERKKHETKSASRKVGIFAQRVIGALFNLQQLHRRARSTSPEDTH